jgi:hypothetical protein
VTEEIAGWKESRIKSLQEAVSFFSNDRKFDRECWVAAHFLKRLEVGFEDEELTAAEEPADVAFRTAKFQVKEVVPFGRRRQAEYREKLDKATTATSSDDFLEQYTPGEVTLAAVVDSCRTYAAQLIAQNRYGTRELSTIDVLFYFNHPGVFEVGTEMEVASFGETQFLSVSVLSNRYAVVLHAGPTAPDFLRSQCGVVHDYRGE